MTNDAPYGVSDVRVLGVSALQKENVARLAEINKQMFVTLEKEILVFNRNHSLISKSAAKNLFQNHIRHCLAIACFDFPPDAHIVDWGSGGGLPAIPLALAFPIVRITAVDKVGKKMQAVEAIVRRLCINNVAVFHGRAEIYHENAAFSVSRATASLSTLWKWHKQVSEHTTRASITDWPFTRWPPGLICLKGGDLKDEIGTLKYSDPDVVVSVLSLEELLNQPYYRDKVIVHVQRAENR